MLCQTLIALCLIAQGPAPVDVLPQPGLTGPSVQNAGQLPDGPLLDGPLPESPLPQSPLQVATQPYVPMEGAPPGVLWQETVPPVLAVPTLAPEMVIVQGSDPFKVHYRGHFLLHSRTLLPVPSEANDLFHTQLDFTGPRMGFGWSPVASLLKAASPESNEDIWTRFKALPNFGLAYDTGFIPGGKFDVQKIALGKDPAAGQTRFTGEGLGQVPLSLLLDNQLRNTDFLGFEQTQLYVEANNYEDRDDLSLRHLAGRAWDGERLSLVVGKTHSLFGVAGVAPATIDQSVSLIGTGTLDNNKRGQLRVQLAGDPNGGWGGGLAVEDPYLGDFSRPGTVTTLTRWPTFAGNLVYTADRNADRFQIAAIVRTLGLQDGSGAEHFETAWGLSACLRLATFLDETELDGLYVGVAGGEGIGQYVHGIQTSAIFSGGQLSTLGGIGGYIGFKRYWITPGQREFATNVAYGFAHMETPALLAADANGELHQAWANLLYFPTKSVAIGMEYQYGMRQTRAMGSGENHRLMFVVALSTAPSKSNDSRYLSEYLLPAALAGYEAGEGPGAAAFQEF